MMRSPILLLTLMLVMLPFAASATVVPDTTTPGRNRASGMSPWCRPAPASETEPTPDARFFKLFYLGVVQMSGPGLDGIKLNTFVPDPVVMLVPRGYARRDDILQVRDGAGMLFSTVYPTFKPFGCADADEDRIEVVFGLRPEPSPTGLPHSLRETVEARWAGEAGATIRAVTVPPGFEEGFIIEFPSPIPGDGHIRTEFLSYRDENGLLLDGHCNPDAEVPGCEFEVALPGTYISVTYRIVKKLLPHRQEIETGLQDLIGKWLADGK